MIFFGKRSSGILVTWPVHLNCASFRRICILCIPAFFRTSVSGILSCLLIFKSFLRQLVWKWFSLLACRWYTVYVSHAYNSVGSTRALWTFSFASSLIPLRSQTLPRSRSNAALALANLALTSSSMCTTLDNVLPRYLTFHCNVFTVKHICDAVTGIRYLIYTFFASSLLFEHPLPCHQQRGTRLAPLSAPWISLATFLG